MAYRSKTDSGAKSGVQPTSEVDKTDSRVLSGVQPTIEVDKTDSRALSGVQPTSEVDKIDSRALSGVQPTSEVDKIDSRALSGVQPTSEVDKIDNRALSGVQPTSEVDKIDSRALSGVQPTSEVDKIDNRALSGVQPTIEVDKTDSRALSGVQPTSEVDGKPSYGEDETNTRPNLGLHGCPNSEIGDLTNQMQQLSPSSQYNLKFIIQNLQNKQAYISEDERGRPVVKYTERPKIWWDPAYANTVSAPRSDNDLKVKMEACLEHIEYIKKTKPPSGIVFDKTHMIRKNGSPEGLKLKWRVQLLKAYRELRVRRVKPHGLDYREKFDFVKTKEVLGRGTFAGDIVVVKDKETKSESAQKTVMISCFRTEEIRCWVDLSGTGVSPELYFFKLEGNKVIIHMEKIENGITLRDVIDNHMSSLRKTNPALVKPFSLYVFHGLLSALQSMHDKGWTHRDLHAGNIMLQKETDISMRIRVLDFGMAVPVEDRDGLSGFRSDVREAVRKFCAMYMGEEFDSQIDLSQNWNHKLSDMADVLNMNINEKEELLCLIDSCLKIVAPHELEKLKKEVDSEFAKLATDNMIDDIMKEAISVLFPSVAHDNLSTMDHRVHGTGDGVVDYLLKLRHSISIGRK